MGWKRKEEGSRKAKEEESMKAKRQFKKREQFKKEYLFNGLEKVRRRLKKGKKAIQ